MLGGKLRNFFAKTISSVQISQVTHLTLPASLLTLGSNVFLSSGVITLTFLGQKAPVIQSETFRDVNKLKEIFIPVGATGYEGGGWPAGKVKTGYDVTIGPADHGSASVSSTIASAGTSITLTAEPDAWYHLKEWMTNPEVEVKDNIFTMPESDVTVTPVFEPHTISNGACEVCGKSFFEGSGTTESPYLIPDLPTLQVFREYISNDSRHGQGEYFKLMADIDLGGSATPWTPIGNNDNPFNGSFDGNNHTISGLYINTSSQYQGLFGCIGEGSAVKNLTVGGAVSGGSYTGGIVGLCKGSLENCHNTATINGGTHVGGIAGSIEGNVSVLNCSNTGTVSGRTNVGGVVGHITGDVAIDNCSNTGKISGTGVIAGGIAGFSENSNSTIKNCRNTGAIGAIGISNVGGIIGNSHSVVTGSYNTGNVTGSSYIGGIAGSNFGTVKNCYNTGEISGVIPAGGVVGSGTADKCYNAGKVTGTGDAEAAGSVVGSGSCTGCYYLDGTADKGTGGYGDTGAAKKSAGAFRFLASSLGEGWADSVVGRPVLLDNPEADIIDADIPYEIPDLDTLKAFRDYIDNSADGGEGKTFILTDSIVLDSDEESPWNPIGDREHRFQGTFDGGNCTISKLYVTPVSAGYDSGLFANIGDNGAVKNLSVSGYVRGNTFVGGVAACNYGVINDCSFDGTATYETGPSSVNVGGITGLSSGSISNCRNNGTVTNNSTHVGGIVGDNRGSVANCSNGGSVTGTGENTQAGGIVGSNTSDPRQCDLS